MMKREKKNIRAFCFFILPSFIGFFVFYIIPLAWIIYYSLIDNITTKTFVGLKNYIDLIQNESFKLAIGNTLIFTAVGIPLLCAFALLLSLMLNHLKLSFFEPFFILPIFLPTASIVLVWNIFFHTKGFINYNLSFFGISPIDFINSNSSIWVIVLLFIWKNLGYTIIIFSASIKSIPVSYYEAAQMDGASYLTAFFHITYPFLKPSIFFAVVISLWSSYKIFREIYLLYGKYPQQSIYMLQHFMNNNLKILDYQKLASATCLLMLVMVPSISKLIKKHIVDI